MDVLLKLATIFPKDRLKTALVERMAFADDAGFYHLVPIAVVQPKDTVEMAQLFALVQQCNIPLVFRAGGTSLSGQSITDGILVDIGKHWRQVTPLDNGNKVKVQPGIIGGMVNVALSEFGRKIGPDPASIQAAMMGGILANNASGMCCGVAYNSYHTLHSLRFMLPSGHQYDTALSTDYDRFEQEQNHLFTTLLDLRQKVLVNENLLATIRSKYRMKNTVGYSLNALVDYVHPLDIMAHLLIGSEGTLGFISEAILHTIPDHPYKAAGMLYFNSMYDACAAIGILKESGAEALELMDRSALRSVETLKGLPDFFVSLPDGATALLCEYQAESLAALQALLQNAENALNSLTLLHPATFHQEAATRNFYWKIRKGMFPSVGAVRQSGSTVILEDIAFPVPHLADAVIALQATLTQFGYHNAIIFGHAKEGNIHFVITQLLDSPEEIDRYDRFMRSVIDLVLHRFGGTLKAEHGTGRNMAPFVAAEWGKEAYEIMCTLKNCIDPQQLFNPGVIINSDPQAHIRHLKQMPAVEAEVDKCIECGFCEHHCPSRDVTLTPRQRIQVRRQLKRFEIEGNTADYQQLLKEYQYAGLDTCATDGLCQADCPVAINTGDLVKRLRKEQHGVVPNRIALGVVKYFALVERILKTAIATGVLANRLLGKKCMPNITTFLRKIVPSMPMWWNELPMPPKEIHQTPAAPQFVYFSACIQRMMGSDNSPGQQKDSIQTTILGLCKKAGIDILLPKNLPGHCCGQAFGSKGYQPAAAAAATKTIAALWQWSDEGRLPIVCDFTSCTATLLHNGSIVGTVAQQQLAQLTIIDSIQFLEQHLLPRLQINNKMDKVVLHPGCAAIKMNISDKMVGIAQQCAHHALVPQYAGCCGMAGDRGFLFPELTNAATLQELDEAKAANANGYYGSAKTCEMALTHCSGKPYQHIAYLLDEVS